MLVFSHGGWVFKLDGDALVVSGNGKTVTFSGKRHGVEFRDLVAFGQGWVAKDRQSEVNKFD